MGERVTTIESAWDCILLPSPLCKRHDDCDPKIPTKNYGRGGMRIRHLYTVSEDLTVQFLWSPGVYLPETQAIAHTWSDPLTGPMAWDLGWHYRYQKPPPELTPDEWGTYDEWPYYGTIMDTCDIYDEGCYYDGSGLNAGPLLDLLIREGDEAMWADLEDYGELLMGRIPA